MTYGHQMHLTLVVCVEVLKQDKITSRARHLTTAVPRKPCSHSHAYTCMHMHAHMFLVIWGEIKVYPRREVS